MRITIFEGPDGGGKSTLATETARAQDAHLVHVGPFKGIKKGLGKLYVEAMLPALLGHRDVVLDRSWISEPVYGTAFRGGADRLGDVGRAMLERVAARCETRVVLCMPKLESCLKVFRSRRESEYLTGERLLEEVYLTYSGRLKLKGLTSLPLSVWSYDHPEKLEAIAQSTSPHPFRSATGGDFLSPIAIVGESFADHRDYDPLLQTPFVAFDQGGCSWWLTKQLLDGQLPQHKFFWVNADNPRLREFLDDRKHVVCLGQEATTRVQALDTGSIVYTVDHPQHAKRFNYKRPYGLIQLLRGLCKGEGL